MPYLGPGIDNGYRSRFIYTATAGQTSFSGGDSQGITLTYTDSEYLDVYQNGVLLVPGDDYAATTGTTVVLVQGASLNDKVEMIQYQAFGVADTVSRADGGAFGGNISTSGTLAVTGASTLTGGIANGVTINGTTPTLTIGDAGAEDAKIVFDGNAQDYHIGLDDSADTLVIGKGSALGTTTAMSFDANGIITKPLQPAFSAYLSANQDNFALNSTVTVVFDREYYDVNADFNTSNYTFTAPVTGKYQINITLRFNNVDTAAGFYQTILTTSNRGYAVFTIDPNYSADLAYLHGNGSILVDMDASDTATVGVYQNNGTQQTDVSSGTDCVFSGYLVA